MSAGSRAAARARRLLSLCLLALFSLFSGAAVAQYRHRVVVLEPEDAANTVEVRARLRGELSAAGFDVVTLQVGGMDDPKTLSETAARELQPAAVLFVVDPPAAADRPHSAEIWLSDRLLRRTFVLTYAVDPADPGKDSARVAVQVAEILKADLAELSVTRQARPETPPSSPPPLPPSPLPPPPRPGDGFRLEAGAGMLLGFEGLASSVAPLLRLGATLPSSWLGDGPVSLNVVLTASAFGSQATTSTASGEARVRQGLGTVGLVARFNATGAVEPLLSLSSGAYLTDTDGVADAPYVARTRRTWSGATGAGAGIWLQPGAGFAVSLQAEVLEAWARTMVRIAGEQAATAGSPMVLVSASVAGVL